MYYSMTATETTLKPSDLRVGNWVQYFDKPCLVKGIKHENNSFYLSCVDNMRDLTKYMNVVDAFKPVELTPEILDKAGFLYESATTLYKEDFAVYFKVDGNYLNSYVYNIWRPIKVACEYVHQLQNLYHSLTGTELEISL